jgi:hypothetical protein
MTLRRIIAEPLLQFLILALVLFHGCKSLDPPSRDRIVVSEATIRGLLQAHAREVGTPQSKAEVESCESRRLRSYPCQFLAYWLVGTYTCGFSMLRQRILVAAVVVQTNDATFSFHPIIAPTHPPRAPLKPGMRRPCSYHA